MTLNMSFSQLVLIVLSTIALIGGVFYLVSLQQLSETISETPNQLFQSKTFSSKQVQNLMITPSSSQTGTVFSLQARLLNSKETQDLTVSIQKENFQEEVFLFDDGNHFDEKSGDGIYGGTVDSKNLALGEYNVLDENQNQIGLFQIYESGCEPLIGGSDPQKINVVILPAMYSDYNQFKQDAFEILSGKDSLLNTEPFKSSQENFSFVLVNTTEDLECEIGCQGVPAAVCCNDKKVFEQASSCHFDNIIVLINSEQRCGTASSYAKICVNSDLSKKILIHEVGHSFGDLADEYVYEGDYESYKIPEQYILKSANCDSEGCEKWADITSGCYPGCTSPNLYRSSENSIMRYVQNGEFNEVSKRHLLNLIISHENTESEFSKNIPSWYSYFALLTVSQDKYEITPVSVKPVRAGFSAQQSSIQARILDSQNKEIYSTYIPVSQFERAALELSDKPLTKNKLVVPLLLPASGNSATLQIVQDEVVVAQTSLESLTAKCGDSSCTKSENNLNCAEDCSIEDNFCESGVCDPDCPNYELCNHGNKGKSISAITLVIVSITILVAVAINMTRKKNK